MKYNVAIIGAGSIGALKDKDLDNPDTKKSLTHAHAFYKSNDFELQIIIDKDLYKAHKAAERWTCEYNDKISDIEHRNIHVAVVAVDTKYHSDVILDLINVDLDSKGKRTRTLKLIVCEKPFCKNMEDAISIRDNCKKYGVKLLINYTRRYCNTYKVIKDYLDRKKVTQVTVRYNRGIKRDGCHALDLCNWFFGRFKSVTISQDKPIKDLPEDSLTYNFITKHRKCSRIYFIGHDYREHGIFEMDIFYGEGRMLLVNYGEKLIHIKNITELNFHNKDIPYWDFHAGNNMSVKKTDLYNMLDNMVDACSKILNKESVDYCTADDAIEVHNIIEKLEDEYNAG